MVLYLLCRKFCIMICLQEAGSFFMCLAAQFVLGLAFFSFLPFFVILSYNHKCYKVNFVLVFEYLGLRLLSLGFSFHEGYRFLDFLVLEQQSFCHVDCNNKNILSSLDFTFCLSLLNTVHLNVIRIHSIYLIDFGAWLLFKVFVAAKLASLNRFGRSTNM